MVIITDLSTNCSTVFKSLLYLINKENLSQKVLFHNVQPLISQYKIQIYINYVHDLT